MTRSHRIWAVVPAAGTGQRMQASLPKQYLTLGGQPVLQITLNKLAQLNQLSGVVVAVSPDDPHFERLITMPPNAVRVAGGRERADSVLRALNYLEQHGCAQDWALVHDAARPCVRRERMQQLIEQVLATGEGGLLAAPVADTLKSALDQRAQSTVDRSHLWQAHTPQMFPVGALRLALLKGLEEGAVITDEASAMELQGERPRLVADSRDNIKITQPEDLFLAEQILAAQAAGGQQEVQQL